MKEREKSMTHEKLFRTFWNNYREEIIGMVNHQLAQGSVDHEVVNRRFVNGLNRWSSIMSSEGEWLQSLDNEEEKKEILQALKQLQLTAPAGSNTRRGNLSFLVGACGGFLGTGIGMLTGRSPLVCGLALVAGAGLGYAAAGSFDKERRANDQKAVLAAYRQQMNDAEEMIAAIWRKYDATEGSEQ